MSFYLDAKGPKDLLSIEAVRIKSSHGLLHKKIASRFGLQTTSAFLQWLAIR
jgi:hypothetical protein